MKRLALVLTFVAGACAGQPRDGETDEQFEVRLRTKYTQPCSEIGLTAHTEQHDKCIIALYRRDQRAYEERAQAIRGQMAIQGLQDFNRQMQQNSQQTMQNMTAPLNNQRNCTTQFIGNTAYTNCR